jgi:hypothetical protein
MARIAYLDHSFHRKTRSTAFLAEILLRYGHSVDYFWDDAWNGGASVGWQQVSGYDVVVMFQAFSPVGSNYYSKLHPNVVYVPMLDQFGVWQGPLFNLNGFWEPFQGAKVLNFSSSLHAMCTGFGIKSHLVRYYPPAFEYAEPPQQGLHGFFWIRREEQLPWRTVRKLISGTKFDSFHVHLACDPGGVQAKAPSTEDMVKYNITTSTWFEDKSEFDVVLARANVFFAPRMEEGIGQSFLEALARGQCVVAPNSGTMNEYIIPGVNGLLYDATYPQALDFSNAIEMGRSARKAALLGRASWDDREPELVKFILAPYIEVYSGKYQHDFGSAV